MPGRGSGGIPPGVMAIEAARSALGLLTRLMSQPNKLGPDHPADRVRQGFAWPLERVKGWNQLGGEADQR